MKKRLYILLPFYLFRYEKNVENIEANEKMRGEIVKEYRELIAKLDEEYDRVDDEGHRLIREVEHQMKKLVDYIFVQEENARNEIGGAIMGGTVMKTIDEELDEMRNEIKEKQRVIKEKEDTIKEKELALSQALSEIERLKNQQKG